MLTTVHAARKTFFLFARISPLVALLAIILIAGMEARVQAQACIDPPLNAWSCRLEALQSHSLL